jgi:simple sugar transport system ATP-binding protein
MHILAGYLSPSSGAIFVDGKERHFSAPADALALGIGMVRQHPAFIRGFKVWEDCVLGAEGQKRKWGLPLLDPGASGKRLKELSNQWDFDLPLEAKTESLTVSQRQKAAVLSLLLRDIRCFIFDEPSAVLTQEETKTLFELFDRLRGEGRSIIFITHKLDEALSIAGRITVIRHGVTGDSQTTKELSVEDLNLQIFGVGNVSSVKEVAGVNEDSPCQSDDKENPVLVIRNLELKLPGLPNIRNINFCVMPGMIMGIAGVRDSGLESLEFAVTGLLPDNDGIKGSITLNGHDIGGKGVRAFRNAGGAYLGADRLGSNLARSLPMKDSLLIHASRRARRSFGIFPEMDFLNSWCKKIMERAGIDRSITEEASSFSGGMLKRILLAREFAEASSLIVLAEPGSALDKSSRLWLVEELAEHKRRGRAALLFSTDMAELISLADEIMILKDGALTKRETNEE